MRAALLALLLVACGGGGGGSKPAEKTTPEPVEEPAPVAEEDAIGNEAPEDAPETDMMDVPSSGLAVCDELIKRVLCMYEKMGDAGADARKAFVEGIKGWQEAAQNDATRQATVDGCQLGLDNSRTALEGQGC